MDDEEARRQFDQMMSFFRQEAKEKAEEILVRARQDFNIEKDRIVHDEKAKIIKEFERRHNQLEVKKKLRLRVLKARDDCVRALNDVMMEELSQVAKKPEEYKALLSKLIIQCLVKLMETDAAVHCRAEDLKLVKSAVPIAVAEFEKLTGIKAKIVVDEKKHLPPGPGPSNKTGQSCCGGVVMSCNKGRIRVANTLDDRLEMVMHDMLPAIRQQLFES